MRFLILTIIILVSAAILQLLLPWWSLVIIAGLWAYLMPLLPRYQSFLAGFLAGFLLWGGYAWYLSSINDGLLADRVGLLLGGMPGMALPILSGFFAALLAGLGALSGRLGLDWVRKA